MRLRGRYITCRSPRIVRALVVWHQAVGSSQELSVVLIVALGPPALEEVIWRDHRDAIA